MLNSLINAWKEGRAVAGLTADRASGRRLQLDYILSRLLRFGKTPGYNALREVRLSGGSTLRYRFNRGDLQSIREVWLDECYALPFSLHPKTILDLGANIGMASLWFQQRYQPTQLLAVECDPDNAGITRLNFSSNGLPGDVLEAAVGASSGTAVFSRSTASNLGSLAPSPLASSNAANLIQVPMVSMGELISRFDQASVDLIKMDIEGAEEAVFSNHPEWLHQTKALIIEWHEDRADPAPLIQKIIQHGFSHHPANTEHQTNLGAFLRV
jgi:FkbM family methyltransferase